MALTLVLGGNLIVLLSAVIVIANSKAIKSLRIVPNDHCIHCVGNRNLPCVVFAHSVGRTTLN